MSRTNPRMAFTKNQTHTWDQILAGLHAAAGPGFHLLHYKGTDKVAAACLKIETNPRAPYEILAGSMTSNRPLRCLGRLDSCNNQIHASQS